MTPSNAEQKASRVDSTAGGRGSWFAGGRPPDGAHRGSVLAGVQLATPDALLLERSRNADESPQLYGASTTT